MTIVYAWIRGIVFYLIFISMLYQLLPGEKYKKYLHVCVGMIFVLVVLTPVIRLFHISDKLSYYINLENFRIASKSGILGEDQSNYKNDDFEADAVYDAKISDVLVQYKNSIEKEIFAQFETSTLYPTNVEIVIDEDENSQDYGCVRQVCVSVITDVKTLESVVTPIEIQVEQVNKQQNASIADDKKSRQEETDEIERMRDVLAKKLNTSVENINIKII